MTALVRSLPGEEDELARRREAFARVRAGTLSTAPPVAPPPHDRSRRYAAIGLACALIVVRTGFRPRGALRALAVLPPTVTPAVLISPIPYVFGTAAVPLAFVPIRLLRMVVPVVVFGLRP